MNSTQNQKIQNQPQKSIPKSTEAPIIKENDDKVASNSATVGVISTDIAQEKFITLVHRSQQH